MNTFFNFLTVSCLYMVVHGHGKACFGPPEKKGKSCGATRKGIMETFDSNRALQLFKEVEELPSHKEKHVCRGYYDRRGNIIRSQFINADKICYKILEHRYNTELGRTRIPKPKLSKCVDVKIWAPDSNGKSRILKLAYVAECHAIRQNSYDVFYISSTPRTNYFYVFEKVAENSALNIYVEIRAIIRVKINSNDNRRILDYLGTFEYSSEIGHISDSKLLSI